jgi:ribokinase
MKSRIYVIGSCNVDHIMRMSRLPEKGETVTNGDYLLTFGGKGANSAVAAAKAGGKVSFVGCIGNDSGGSALRSELNQFGVDTAHLRVVPGIATGQALVMVGAAGGNYLSVAPGANHCLREAEIGPLLENLDSKCWVLLQNEIPIEVNLAVLRAAREKEFTVLFNFAPIVQFPLEALEGLGCLLVNETEADGLLSFAGGKPLAESDPTAAALSLRKMGIDKVVITLGARGVVVATSEGVESIAPLRVEAIDTTAAGDTFSGAFAVALSEGAETVAAARFANSAAALSVTRPGAMISSPLRSEIEEVCTAPVSGCRLETSPPQSGGEY